MRDTFPKHAMDEDRLRASDNADMVGSSYMHTRSRYLYRVTDIVWNGNDDLWMVEHTRAGTATKFVRSLANFNGEHNDGTRRFIRIKEDS